MNAAVEKYNEVIAALIDLNTIDEQGVVERTSQELRNINYQPPFLLEVPDFTDLTRKEALAAAKAILDYDNAKIMASNIGKLKGAVSVKATTLTMFFKEYSLLQRLRRNDPTAWDQINELYEDD